MKKTLAILLSILIVLSLSACGGGDDVVETPEPVQSTEPTAAPVPTPEQSAEPEPTETVEPESTPEPTVEPTGTPEPQKTEAPEPTPTPGTNEDIDEEGDISVDIVGDDVVVTLKTPSEQGLVVCYMIYGYNHAGTKLQSLSAKYELPTEELATELMAELKADDTVSTTSIKQEGRTVECTFSDDEISAISGISRSMLKSALDMSL